MTWWGERLSPVFWIFPGAHNPHSVKKVSSACFICLYNNLYLFFMELINFRYFLGGIFNIVVDKLAIHLLPWASFISVIHQYYHVHAHEIVQNVLVSWN